MGGGSTLAVLNPISFCLTRSFLYKIDVSYPPFSLSIRLADYSQVDILGWQYQFEINLHPPPPQEIHVGNASLYTRAPSKADRGQDLPGGTPTRFPAAASSPAAERLRDEDATADEWDEGDVIPDVTVGETHV